MMSSKTSYFCDQCKKETEYKELTSIQLELNPYSSYKTQRFDKVYQYFDLCDSCTERLGFIVKKKDEKENIIVKPTTAEKLYEVIAQMIQENIN